MTDNKQPVLVKIKPAMAKSKGIPVYFVGIPYIETQKAYKFIGRGVSLKKAMGICSICGKILTNPNSIKLGIGPVCAAAMGIKLLTGITQEEVGAKMEEILVDTFLPKSCVELSKINDINIPDIVIPNNNKTRENGKPTQKKVEIKQDIIVITFPFDYATLANVKSLSGRRYNKQPNPHWTCPNTEDNKQKLIQFGFTLPDTTKTKTEIKKVTIPDFPSHLKSTLFPFQKEGVQFIYKNYGRALIGDEMGLGKTIQALTYLEMENNIKIALIICPASLKYNWAAEIQKWMTDYNLYILSGKKGEIKNLEKFQTVKSKTAKKTIIIINYDIMIGWEKVLLKTKLDIIIADEIHYIKNQKAQRTKAVKKIGKETSRFIGLSGTPIINRPVEFFNGLNLINPHLFNSFWSYAKKYCGTKHTRFGWDFTGSTNQEELHKIVKNVMIRRKKSKVMKELPKKIRTVVPIEIDNKSEYSKAHIEVAKELEELIKRKIEAIPKELTGKKREQALQKANQTGGAEQLMLIEKLKQLCVKGKIKAAIKWIQDYLEIADKLVIFTTHTDTLNLLQETFGNICIKVDGSVTSSARQIAVNTFQTDPNKKIFLGNIKAAGVGLTLTAANATCFIEFPWSPGETDQAEDRVHRIGQTANSVHAYYLCGINTIDEKIMEMLDAKRKVLSKLLDGKTSSSYSLMKLLEK